MAKIKFNKGKLTGMVLKTERKKKHEMISKAKRSDIKGMSTKDKIKFGTDVKLQSKKKK